MHTEDIARLTLSARRKIQFMKDSPLGYLTLSLLAGVYVGFGIILIFAVGGPIQAGGGGAYLKLVMGASFGIALSLVVFAGSELFTGNNMVFAVSHACRETGPGPIAALFALCYLGNLLGSVFLSWLVVAGGSLAPASRELAVQVAALKMNTDAGQLFVRGILCNWLVCLAVWMSGRTQSDSAKLILIFWCLFAFISSGFEHCVANMTLLSLALFLPHGADVSLAGFGHNLLWVSLGNLVGGGVMVGLAYWFTTRPAAREPAGEAESPPAGWSPVTLQEK